MVGGARGAAGAGGALRDEVTGGRGLYLSLYLVQKGNKVTSLAEGVC